MAKVKRFFFKVSLYFVTACLICCQMFRIYIQMPGFQEKRHQLEKTNTDSTNSSVGMAFGPSYFQITMPFFKCKLFVGILSANTNFERRQSIRNTWAKYPGNWTRCFIIGLPLVDEIRRENDTYRDIILVHKKEAFFGEHSVLPVKTATIYFVGNIMKPEWVFKTDDDSFVDIMKLFRTIELFQKPFYGGLIWHKAPPVRSKTSISYVSSDQWQGYYPDYASGAGYLVSQDLADCFLKKINVAVRMPREDVFSGILAKECNVKATQIPDFLYHNPNNKNALIRHKIKPADMIKIWNYKKLDIQSQHL